MGINAMTNADLQNNILSRMRTSVTSIVQTRCEKELITMQTHHLENKSIKLIQRHKKKE